MRILAVDWKTPRPDRSSGDLRFFTLLSLLAKQHEVSFLSLVEEDDAGVPTWREALAAHGIQVRTGSVQACLSGGHFDMVLAEFHGTAAAVYREVRAWQPSARLVIDSVDVHFHRMRSKARLTGKAEDAAAAEGEFAKEMWAYNLADMVLAVSEHDRQVLEREGLATEMLVIPNIHAMQALQPRERHDPNQRLELLFIGSYAHQPNVDAVVYFCREIMPLLRAEVASLRLRLVGSAASDEVRSLAADDIEVVGFVEDTTPYLLSSDVSVAPLRYGAGIKGKIGEAMAHGVPVVTTSVGAEGFGFEPGRDFMVADTPHAFAQAVLALQRDPALRERIRLNGWQRIDERFSVNTVERVVDEFVQRAQQLRPKRLSAYWKARTLAAHYTNRLRLKLAA